MADAKSTPVGRVPEGPEDPSPVLTPVSPLGPVPEELRALLDLLEDSFLATTARDRMA